MVKITNKNLLLLAEKYNSDGKKEMYRFIKEHYGIKNPTCILDRMKKASILGYNSNADTFLMKEPSSSQEEKLFMSMDELCSPTVTVHEYPAKQLEKDNNEMQKLIQNLIGDRLLLEPGRINHSETGRNRHSEFNRKSQCTYLTS